MRGDAGADPQGWVGESTADGLRMGLDLSQKKKNLCIKMVFLVNSEQYC